MTEIDEVSTGSTGSVGAGTIGAGTIGAGVGVVWSIV